MNIRNLFPALSLFLALGLGNIAQAANAPLNCTIRTVNGHYLTAVGGGGRITDVIHSDATQLLDWEKIKFVSLGYGWYALQTFTGHYLTAVGGGGRVTDVIHSDATAINNWEKFRLNCWH